jgi:hypothetical protein
MIVTGAGSRYSASGNAGEIHVGCETCTATLEVLNGATFTNAVGYGLRSWSGVNIIVVGVGSRLTVSGSSMDVGFDGKGSQPTALILSNGGVGGVGANNIRVGANSAVVISATAGSLAVAPGSIGTGSVAGTGVANRTRSVDLLRAGRADVAVSRPRL